VGLGSRVEKSTFTKVGTFVRAQGQDIKLSSYTSLVVKTEERYCLSQHFPSSVGAVDTTTALLLSKPLS
jgi:hypothetical protein